ncbi:MAG: class I SAM-dependent methyltransferase [Haloferacaceae archaeon]
MRRFSADYLAATRAGLWADRTALAPCSLANRERVVDAGAGTGAFTRVLREETPPGAEVVAVDADRSLLAHARSSDDPDDADAPYAAVAGDAGGLPLRDDAADLVAAQALLVNLPDPAAAVREFARVSTDLVAVVEPDNASVGVDSTVAGEADLDRRARAAYRAGVATDLAPGDRVAGLFERAGLAVEATRRHHHEKRVDPPYDERAYRAARRKASGAALDEMAPALRASLGDDGFGALRDEWREMGRATVEAMNEGTYRRVEVVPFDVTVGSVRE